MAAQRELQATTLIRVIEDLNPLRRELASSRLDARESLDGIFTLLSALHRIGSFNPHTKYAQEGIDLETLIYYVRLPDREHAQIYLDYAVAHGYAKSDSGKYSITDKGKKTIETLLSFKETIRSVSPDPLPELFYESRGML